MECSLTSRERQLCQLSNAGYNCKEIARHLNISIHTVYKHRVNLLHKLGMNNMIQVQLYMDYHDHLYRENVTSILTYREMEIASELITGKTYKEIAKSLAIHPSTVSKHREHIYQKLNIHCVLQLRIVLYDDSEIVDALN